MCEIFVHWLPPACINTCLPAAWQVGSACNDKLWLSVPRGHLCRHARVQVWNMAIALYLVGTVVWNAFSTGGLRGGRGRGGGKEPAAVP